MVLILHLCRKDIEINTYALAVSKRHGNHGHGITRNGVMKVTAADRAKTQVILVNSRIEETCQYLVGIGKALLYVIARVSAVQLIHAHAQEHESLRNGLSLIIKLYLSVDAACAADEYLALILRVKVNKHPAVHHARLKVLSTRQARLFRYGKEALHRAMLNLAGIQDSQSHCNAHTVIGPKSGAACLEPAVLNVCLNGLGKEIVLKGGILFTDHILMCLQNHRRTVLITRCGGL